MPRNNLADRRERPPKSTCPKPLLDIILQNPQCVFSHPYPNTGSKGYIPAGPGLVQGLATADYEINVPQIELFYFDGDP